MDENKLFHSRNQQDRESISDYDKAVPPSVSRDIVKDHINKPTSFPSTPSETPGLPNFVEPTPLGPVANLALIDKIAASFALRDKIQLARELGVKLPEEPPKDPA